MPRTGTPQGGRLSGSKEADGRPGGSVLAGRGQYGARSSPAAEATAACQDATLAQALPSAGLTRAQLPLTPAVIGPGPPQDTQCPAWRSEKEPARPIFQGFTRICRLCTFKQNQSENPGKSQGLWDMKEPEKWAPASALEPVSHLRPDQEALQPGDSQLGLWTLRGQGLPKNLT